MISILLCILLYAEVSTVKELLIDYITGVLVLIKINFSFNARSIHIFYNHQHDFSNKMVSFTFPIYLSTIKDTDRIVLRCCFSISNLSRSIPLLRPSTSEATDWYDTVK